MRGSQLGGVGGWVGWLQPAIFPSPHPILSLCLITLHPHPTIHWIIWYFWCFSFFRATFSVHTKVIFFELATFCETAWYKIFHYKSSVTQSLSKICNDFLRFWILCLYSRPEYKERRWNSVRQWTDILIIWFSPLFYNAAFSCSHCCMFSNQSCRCCTMLDVCIVEQCCRCCTMFRCVYCRAMCRNQSSRCARDVWRRLVHSSDFCLRSEMLLVRVKIIKW